METKQYKKHIVIKPSIHLCHTPLSLKALTHATDKVMVFLECLSPYFHRANGPAVLIKRHIQRPNYLLNIRINRP